ncbi:MAG: polysaccharide biosynthesis/export family protein [Terracidiphilus sp.]
MAIKQSIQYPERLGCANNKEFSVIRLNPRNTLAIFTSMSLLICSVCPGIAGASPLGNMGPNGEPAQAVQQASNSAAENPPNPTLKLSPLETLRRFEPPVDEEYTLGAGDDISIQYPGRTELATKSAIGPDGRITLPLAGPIVVANLTREAAAQKIAAAMSAYYTNISATVEVVSYGSNHVTLLGDVKSPGLIEFTQTPTLLEVLSKGGVETRLDGNLPEQCVIYRGDQVFWIELHELLSTGSPLADLRLRRNDVIFVPALSARTISVIGQVQHPGEIPLRHDSTITSILGEAGGISDSAGNNPELQIVHRTKGDKTQYVRFKDLLKPTGGLEVSLYPGDVIFVPKSGLAKTGFVMQQLAPFLSVGGLATAVAVR